MTGASALHEPTTGQVIPVSMQMQRAWPRRGCDLQRPRFRALFYQLVLLAALVWLAYEFVLNAKANLDAQKITSGFGFLNNTAGFGVNQSLIPYNESDTYGRVVPRRAAQYAPGRRAWHRARNHARFCDRHCAAIAQLAPCAHGRRAMSN